MMRPLVVLAALLASAFPAEAQFATTRLGAGASFETYSFSDAERVNIESLRLLSTPFAAAVAITPRVELQVAGAWARGELVRPGGEEASISGLTDTEVRLTATVGRDALRITGIAQLPTGVSELTSQEADAAGNFAADVLPFRVTNWGAGGGFGVSTAVAGPVGAFALGLSAGYVVAREFEPIAGAESQYRPGNQLHVRAAIDRTFGSSSKASLSLTWMNFGEDQVAGENLFRTGDRLQALASWAFAAGPRSSGVVYGGWLHRAEGEFLDETRLEPGQDLFYGGFGARLPGGSAVFQPQLDVRVHSSDTDAGSGYTVGVGGSVEFAAGGMLIVPTLRGRLGSVELGSGADSGFTGLEAGLALRF